MKRKSFFKSLLGVIITPKIISEIDWDDRPCVFDEAKIKMRLAQLKMKSLLEGNYNCGHYIDIRSLENVDFGNGEKLSWQDIRLYAQNGKAIMEGQEG